MIILFSILYNEVIIATISLKRLALNLKKAKSKPTEHLIVPMYVQVIIRESKLIDHQ